QGLLTGLVGAAGNANGAFSSGEGLVAGQESEALGLVPQQHSAQVAVTQTNLPVLGNGAGDAESLQADADGLSGLSGGLDALLHGDGSAYGVGPGHVLEADGLNILGDGVGVEALGHAQVPALLHGVQAVLSEDTIDLVDLSFVTFKQSHCAVLLLFVTGVDILGSVLEAAVVTLGLLQSGGSVIALLDEVHHLAQVDEFVAD